MEILLVPIIGAVIGLFTNWLAIKMLFLPRKEYRLFGYRVPFTPGVLPKSQTRVAKNLGHAVGDYLLTDETLAQAITSTGIDEELFAVLDSIFSALKANESTLGEVLEKLCDNDYAELSANAKQALLATYINYINEPSNLNKIKGFAFEKVKEFLTQLDTKEIGAKSIAAVNDYTQKNGIPLMNRGEIEGFVDSLVQKALKWLTENESDIKTLVSDKNEERVKVLVASGIPVIFAHIKNILDNNEELDQRFGEFTRKIVEDSVGQFVGSVVHRKVYLSIRSSLDEFLSSEEGKEKTINLVNEKINQILQRKPADIMALVNIGDELKNSLRTRAVSGIVDNHRAVADYIFNGSAKYLSKTQDIDMHKLANRFVPDFDIRLKFELDKIIDDVIEKHSVPVFEQIYEHAGDKIMNIPINKIASGAGEKIYLNLINLLEKNKEMIMEKCVSAIIGKLDISKTVEDKINELDVKQMEDIVLEVARKELNYITYMGGLLGFIMGFIPELINKFMM